MKIYRAENIGSMLRPNYLLDARAKRDAGAMDAVSFKNVEDRAVDECIAIQEGCCVDILCDGEMRRNVFSSQLAEAAEGFESGIEGNSVVWFTLDGKRQESPVTVGVTDRIRMKRNLSAEEFTYLRAHTSKPTKMTIPSPTMYAYYWVPGLSESAYPSTDAYMEHITEILKDEVAELVRLGCEYVQFDAPEFGMLLDPVQQEWFENKGFPPGRMFDQGIELMNAIIDDFPNTTFGLHICRGNDATRYMAKGGYANLARQVFAGTKAQVLLLEYDDERSGDFQPLAEVPDDKIVVLGLLTTKQPREETAAEIKQRIAEASQYVPMERLALSTQCGFASVAKGNNIPFSLQSRKLSIVVDVAREVWED